MSIFNFSAWSGQREQRFHHLSNTKKLKAIPYSYFFVYLPDPSVVVGNQI
jgi:hypothetical protein